MPCDYESIRKNNIIRYGTDIGRTGRMLLADRYDDRAHFIYELLQNAEDAFARRVGWQGPRVVKFDLNAERLRVSHCGVPFDKRHQTGAGDAAQIAIPFCLIEWVLRGSRKLQCSPCSFQCIAELIPGFAAGNLQCGCIVFCFATKLADK